MEGHTIRFTYGFITPFAYGDEQLYTMRLYDRHHDQVYAGQITEDEKDNYLCNKTILLTAAVPVNS